MKLNTLFRYIPTLIWMGIIFFFSSQNTTGIEPTFTSRFIFFKSLHLLEYAALFLLNYYATKKTIPSVFLGYLYALTDELHQSFTPGRTPKLTDTFIDLVGLCLGYVLLRLLLHQNKSILKQ